MTQAKIVNKVTKDETEHNAQLIAKSQSAQVAFQEAEELVAEAERTRSEARDNLVGVQGAVQEWMAYLQKKYNLPDMTGIDLEGNINRPD